MFKDRSFKNNISNNMSQDYSEEDWEPRVPKDLWDKCPFCKRIIYKRKIASNQQICYECGYHLTIGARERLELLVGKENFQEIDTNLQATDFLEFPGYKDKLETAVSKSGEVEAVICGIGRISTFHCAIFIMEPLFMMGSMGIIVGEKITRLFELATDNSLPVIGVIASGGARMQEGIFSLLQMAKISGAVKKHSGNGNLYISILTNPTTGGVTASFAMEGDIIVAEPKARIGFAGPRVIEQTTGQKLSSEFQMAETLLEKGFIDCIVDRRKIKNYLSEVLKLHCKERVKYDGCL